MPAESRWCAAISRPHRGPSAPGPRTHSPFSALTAPRPWAERIRSPSRGRQQHRHPQRSVPVRGQAPPEASVAFSRWALEALGVADSPSQALPGSGRAPPARSLRAALPAAPLLGWAGPGGDTHPLGHLLPPARRRRPRPGQGPGERRGGKWRPGRPEVKGRSRTMRLLRALLRCAAPGSASPSNIPQQVDFYSRFSPSPLSMKQFLDFGESLPSRPRALPPLPQAPVRSGTATTPHPVSAARLLLIC